MIGILITGPAKSGRTTLANHLKLALQANEGRRVQIIDVEETFQNEMTRLDAPVLHGAYAIIVGRTVECTRQITKQQDIRVCQHITTHMNGEWRAAEATLTSSTLLDEAIAKVKSLEAALAARGNCIVELDGKLAKAQQREKQIMEHVRSMKHSIRGLEDFLYRLQELPVKRLATIGCTKAGIGGLARELESILRKEI
jgi:energy-coupling factor transporter ATP-binding protein EcfA2